MVVVACYIVVISVTTQEHRRCGQCQTASLIYVKMTLLNVLARVGSGTRVMAHIRKILCDSGPEV